jgi:hypothetical protein
MSLQSPPERTQTSKFPACIHFRENDDQNHLFFKGKNILYLQYEYAILCRNDENTRGINGRYFRRAKDIIIVYNDISKFMKDQYLILLTAVIVVMYLYLLSLVSHIK